MKKKIAVLLSLVMSLSMLLCGCGSNGQYAEVNGTKYGIKEIGKTIKDNEIKFDDEFKGEQVTIVGEISQINGASMYGEQVYQAMISVGGGYWDAYIEESNCELSSLNVGDKVKITGTIVDNSAWSIYVIDAYLEK